MVTNLEPASLYKRALKTIVQKKLLSHQGHLHVDGKIRANTYFCPCCPNSAYQRVDALPVLQVSLTMTLNPVLYRDVRSGLVNTVTWAPCPSYASRGQAQWQRGSPGCS